MLAGAVAMPCVHPVQFNMHKHKFVSFIKCSYIGFNSQAYPEPAPTHVTNNGDALHINEDCQAHQIKATKDK